MANPLQKVLRKIRESWRKKRFRPRWLSRPIEIAVIGSGKAAAYHLETLRGMGNVRVACLVNRGRSDPAPLLREHGIKAHFTSLDQALAGAKFEAAIVAVSPESTAAVAGALIEAGKRLLIEKPLALSAEAAVPLARLDPDRRHCVGYNRRFFSSVLRAREVVASLGGIFSIHLEAPEPMFKIVGASGAGALSDRLVANTTHGLDLFTLFCGRSTEVRALFARKEVGGVRVSFQTGVLFEKGCNGSFISHWESPGEWVATLYGHGFKVTVNLHRNECLVQTGKQVLKTGPSDEDRFFKSGVYLQNWTFLDAVAREVPCPEPLCSLGEACETLRLAESILRAV